MTLYPDQQADFQRLRAAYLEHRHVLFVAPTGYGKTVMACAITAGAAEKQTRTCFIVHRKELIAQTTRAFTLCGIPHGIISPDYPATRAPIQIASVFTLARRKGHEFDLLIWDECHHRVANAWSTVAAKFADARSLGLTATPARLDGRGLGDSFEHMVLTAPMRQLISMNRLSPYDYWAPEVADLSGLWSRGGADYSQEALERAMADRRITGNVIGHYRRICDGAPFLCQCVSVAHAQQVAEDFRAAGYPVAALWGAMDPVERTRTVAELGGRLVGLTFVDLISEGFDVPGVTCIISLRKTKSLTLYLQVMGRGLRYVPGKRAQLIDCVGNTVLHAVPDTPRDWVLEKDRGVRTDPDDPDTPAIRRCERCYAVHEWAPVCPYCGHVYEVAVQKPPVVKRGELIRLTEEQIKELEAHAKRTGRLADWHEVAKQRGHKPGWAYHQARRAHSVMRRAR